MDDRIQNLPGQIAALEEELQSALHQRQSRVLFYLHGRRIEFESGVRKAHQRLKRNLFRWVITDRPQNLLAYATEITARTEQYFCPIKHARKVLGTHARYSRFLEYGEAADYHQKLEQFRHALAHEASAATPASPVKPLP